MNLTPDFVKTMQPLLSREVELVLFDEWQEARRRKDRRRENALFQQIITQYSPIVKKLTKKMRGYGLDQTEVMSEALLALTKAAIDFEADKGFRFGTYASACILNSLYTYVTKNYFIVNVCSNNKNKKAFFSLRRVLMKQVKETGNAELTYEMAKSISDDLDIDVETIQSMAVLLRDPYSSLNQLVGDGTDEDSATRQDMLVSQDRPQDDVLSGQQSVLLQHKLIREALASLDERSRVIVESQSLTPEGERITLEELGDTFKISKERARQIRDASLEKIRLHIEASMAKQNVTIGDLLPTQ